MRKSIYFLIAIMWLCSYGIARGMSAERRDYLSDSIRERLSQVTSTADSVPLLFNLFDLSTGEGMLNYGEMLLRTVLRTNDTDMQYNVLRRYGAALAAAPDNHNSDIEALLDITMTLPEGSARSNTATYLEVQKIINDFATAPDSVKQNQVHQAIRRRTTGAGDQYEDVVLLFTLSSYLASNSPGELVIDYLGQLYRQIRALPARSYSLESMYLEQASIIYTRAGLHEEAVEMCKEHLRVMGDLDRANQKMEHRYRDYSSVYYHAYLRLLNNFEALTPEEIDEYYLRMQQLAAEDPEISSDHTAPGRMEIYYHMGKKHYAKALELLKKHVKYPENEPHLSSLYNFMMKAATEVGDKEAQLEASLGIIKVLNEALEERRHERKQEILILKEMINLQNERAVSAQDQVEMYEEHHRNLVTYGSIAIGLLGLVALVVFMLYRRIRQMKNKLAESNDMLREERDNLQRTQRDLIKARDHARKADRHKTEFINNMSHEVREPLESLVECAHLIVDNVDESKWRYLDKYARIIDVCSDMLTALVNDVLLLAESDNSDVEISKKLSSANTMCELAVMSMRKQCKDGVTMTFQRHDEEDVTVDTDTRRVEQVLLNLLSNAAKFTDEGSIELSYKISPEEGTITFMVTDTGIGIPRGKEEIIFERFEKLSSFTPGMGLGLNICRLVAHALGGTVAVDTSYTEPGARFLFTIPL